MSCIMWRTLQVYMSVVVFATGETQAFLSRAEQQSYQPLRGPHINQLIAQETAKSRGVEVCTSKSRIVVRYPFSVLKSVQSCLFC